MKLEQLFENIDKELVEKIINEDSDEFRMGKKPDHFNDALSSLQIGILNKIKAGQFDPFGNISQKGQEALDNLVTLGLLDAAYGLTNAGFRAADSVTQKNNTNKRLMAIQKAGMKNQNSATEKQLTDAIARLEADLKVDPENDDKYLRLEKLKYRLEKMANDNASETSDKDSADELDFSNRDEFDFDMDDDGEVKVK